MTKFSTFLTLTAITLSSLAVQQAFTFSSGPPNATTNAPGEGVCTDCHGGTQLNAGNAGFTIGFASDTATRYIPGQTYAMTVGFNNTNHPTNGFELTAIGANGSNGTLIVEDAANTQISASGGRQYLKHTSAGHRNRTTWTFKWTAPAAGSGVVTLYAAGNNANGNGGTSGDSIYTSSLRLPEGTLVAVKPAAIVGGSLAAFPNPAKSMTNVSFALSNPAQASLALYDLQGHRVLNNDLGLVETGKHTQRFDIPPTITAGTYILRLEANNKASAMRMTIL